MIARAWSNKDLCGFTNRIHTIFLIINFQNMSITAFRKAALLTLVLVVVFVGGYEIYLRSAGFVLDYDDGPELWSDKRAMVYGPKEDKVIFIGSSRIKYDLDIPTWESETGTHAIQLAMVGSSPRHFLDDLAEDSAFKGRLVVDVTESIFFGSAPRFNVSPDEGIKYYKKRTPAQKAGFVVNHWLESQLLFLNKDFFSLNALLGDLPLKDRPGFQGPRDFPFGFGPNQFDRQSKMSDEFLSNIRKQDQVKAIWAGIAKATKGPPVNGPQLDSIFLAIKKDVDMIRSRGGEVWFTRTPSSGPFLELEKRVYPRSQYWEKLLSVTGCDGYHFSDDPSTDHFICPENSHLRPSDAILYTRSLAKILKQKMK